MSPAHLVLDLCVVLCMGVCLTYVGRCHKSCMSVAGDTAALTFPSPSPSASASDCGDGVGGGSPSKHVRTVRRNRLVTASSIPNPASCDRRVVACFGFLWMCVCVSDRSPTLGLVQGRSFTVCMLVILSLAPARPRVASGRRRRPVSLIHDVRRETT